MVLLYQRLKLKCLNSEQKHYRSGSRHCRLSLFSQKNTTVLALDKTGSLLSQCLSLPWPPTPHLNLVLAGIRMLHDRGILSKEFWELVMNLLPDGLGRVLLLLRGLLAGHYVVGVNLRQIQARVFIP